MSRSRNKRKTTGPMGSVDVGAWFSKIFTKDNIQTGIEVVQQVTDKTKNGGTVTYNGSDAQISGAQSYLNYAIIGGVGLAVVYFMNKGKK